MSEVTVPWTEHLHMIRRVGRLEGAIEAHRILIGSDAKTADRILWTILDQGREFPLGDGNE
jgi:hypothetical protein